MAKNTDNAPVSTGSALRQLEDNLDLYLRQKAPALPANIKELIVKIAPWLTIVMLVIAVPGILMALGLGAIAAPLSFLGGVGAGVSFGMSYTLSMVVLFVAIVLEAMAVPGLFSRSRSAWRLVYYSTLVSLVSSLITFNIIGGLLSALIGFYILFQVKEYYK